MVNGFLIAALAMTSPAETPPAAWRCTNDVEVWCTVDSCAAKAEGETTPMDIHASRSGEVSVCAYTGCWEAQAKVTTAEGRALWTTAAAAFMSGEMRGPASDLTLLIVEKDGAGFVRVGGIASPLLCSRRQPGE